MIKKLIFDLDNTLIMWKDEYVDAIAKSISKFNIKCDPNYMSNLVDEYENYYDRYDKDLLIEFINERIDSKVDMNFINDFLYNIGFCGDVDDSVIDTLEYLSGKYELVVLTNWFTEAQSNRLRSADIDKYFSKVYGGDLILKPEKQAFINAAGNTKLEECIMIGDSYNLDVMGAYNAGIRPIFMNPKHKENKNNFEEIEKLSDLKDIL